MGSPLHHFQLECLAYMFLALRNLVGINVLVQFVQRKTLRFIFPAIWVYKRAYSFFCQFANINVVLIWGCCFS